MADHHPRLARQLAELGIDPSKPVAPDRLARLLERVSGEYAHAARESDTLMTVLDTLSETTCHVDQHGILRGVNDRAWHLLRVDPRTLIDRPLLEVVPIEDGDGRRLGPEDLRSDRRIEHGTVTRPDGSRFAAAISISRIAPGRRNEGAVILLRDIEDLLAREEDLQRARVELIAARKAEQAKSLFLANMSHELRTPLNAIVGYAELLWEDAQSSGRAGQAADLERILGAARHLNQLIGDILDLSKIEAGHMELEIEPCDAVALAREALDTLRGATALELRLVVAEPPPRVRADVTRLRQCLLNLLSNAVKFTPRGSVTVRIADDRDSVRIAVEDTGIGIAPDALPRLFSEFVQAEPGTARRFGGTGLGLAISRRLCRLMGGDIEVRSAVGHGSTFTIVLPAWPEPARVVPADRAARRAPPARKRVGG